MTAYLKFEDKLMTCPYDEAHKVKNSRFQIHLTKCRVNHLDQEKEACPFNATHLFNKSEKSYHLATCPDRGVLDRSITAKSLNENNPLKGRTAVPSYTASDQVFESDEVWDMDAEQGPGFIPQGPPPGAILNPGDTSKPAERRKFYQELHRTNADINIPKEHVKVYSKPAEPRQPKVMSEASKLQGVENQFSNESYHAGFGRGRIAASIFPPDSTDQIDHRSFSSITNGINQLVIGRGRRPVQTETFVPSLDDFPELGLGRGLMRNPRSAKAPGDKPTHQKS